MRVPSFRLRPCLLALFLPFLAGCGSDETPAGKDAAKKESVKKDDGKADKTDTARDDTPPYKPNPDAKRVKTAQNVTLEIDGDKRRVLVDAYVCQPIGQLEQFLTKKNTKEHEAVLAADVDAREIHAALLLAGAEPGSPVKFEDGKEFRAKGNVIRIYVSYKKGDKTIVQRAQQWIRHAKTKKDMEHDWVFGGSHLDFAPDDPMKKGKPFYGANNGDVICVANSPYAMLDLPISSTGADAELMFEANGDRVPPEGTPVTVILEPVTMKKK